VIDRHTFFGIFTLFFALFFISITGKDSPHYIFYIAFPYASILFFHKYLERQAQKVKNPLFWYGIFVFLGGMLIEFFAYKTSIFLVALGKNPVVFCPESLACDLFLFGLPHYILIALGFMWTLRRYDFSVLQLGLVIFLFWAIVVDQFSHFVGLFVAGIPGIIGFVQAGLLMVFAFHGPYIIFQKRIRELFPARSISNKKYIPLVLFQGAAILLVLCIAIARHIIG
jgi:hypothetical protein